MVSKQLDEFREKTQPQLGCVHDPLVIYDGGWNYTVRFYCCCRIADTLTVSQDHTFGVLVQADDYSMC